MGFVQVIEFRTNDLDAVQRANEQWQQATQGTRTAERIVLGRQHDDSGHCVEIVFFDSWDDAARNDELPATQDYAEQIRGLIDGEPRYLDVDVVSDERL